jgi:universal stress protein E
MKPIRLILVALKSLGPECHRTVVNAARLARGLRADLELFHVIDMPLYADSSGMDDDSIESTKRERRAHCSGLLERIAERVRRCGLKVGTATEWDHPVAEAIIRRSTRIGADLLVTERRHPIGSFLHPTERELLRLSPVPTLLATSSTPPYRHPLVVAAVDPARSHGKPATLDEEILRTSDAIHHALAGTLQVLHAYAGASSAMPLEMQALPNLVEETEAREADDARRSVTRLLASCEIPPAQCHVVDGPVKDAIYGAIRSNRCPLIVMGAAPRSGLKALLIGNTAERLLDDLRCDVLVVKPPSFESQVPRARRGARLVSAAAFP